MSKYTKHTHTHTINLYAIVKTKVSRVQYGSVSFSGRAFDLLGDRVDIRGRLPCVRVGTRVCHLTSPEHTTETTVNGQQVRTFPQIHQSLL